MTALSHAPQSQQAAHIVVVEDELDVAEIVRDYLLHAGYRVSVFGNGRQALEALQALQQLQPDLIVLDIMLPEVSGTEILRDVRQRSTVPVIMVTARVEELDRLLALEWGADDYLCKPFSPRELVARVRAVLRRTVLTGAVEAPDAPQAVPLVVDVAAQRVWVNGHDLAVTPKEFALFQLLAHSPGRVYSRAAMLDQLYRDDWDVNDRAVDSHIKNLRRKLAAIDPAYAAWIRSVYGVGFSLEVPADVQGVR